MRCAIGLLVDLEPGTGARERLSRESAPSTAWLPVSYFNNPAARRASSMIFCTLLGGFDPARPS
jgi:hypothetical protein